MRDAPSGVSRNEKSVLDEFAKKILNYKKKSKTSIREKPTSKAKVAPRSLP